MIPGLSTIVRCQWCHAEAEVHGPSVFPTGPKGWIVDRANFYLPHGRHRCPRHAHISASAQLSLS